MSEQTPQPDLSGNELFQQNASNLLLQALRVAKPQEFLKKTLDEALRCTGGKRAFVALIEQDSGELAVAETAGPDWNEEARRIRLRPHNETERGITGYVAISGEPYLARDVGLDPHYLPYFEEVRSEAAVPFFDDEGKVRGVLSVDSPEIDRFDSAHLIKLTTLANTVATFMAFEEFRNRERLLVQIGMDLTSITDIDALGRRAVEVGAEALQCEACSLFLLEESSQLLILRASRGTLQRLVGKASYALGEGLTGSVALTGETFRLDDPKTEPRWVGRHPEFASDEQSAYMAVPVIGREKILGVLRVSRPRNAPSWFRARFSEGDEGVLRTLGSQLGNAIENLRNFDRLVRSERMAAWGELSAKSAHMMGNRTFAVKGDLNELKYILSQSEMTLSDPKICADVVALVNSIERGVFKLEDILREFRDFVMATQLALKEGDINTIVRESVEETFPKRSSVTLAMKLEPNLPSLLFDAEKLKRALSELIENAVSFMQEGGELRIETNFLAAGEAPKVARLSPNRGYVHLSISDTGPGVQPDLKQKIFKPFFSSRVKGMGLGLSIVKGIVDSHHGTIRESGEFGKGAEFMIFLPVPEGAA